MSTQLPSDQDNPAHSRLSRWIGGRAQVAAAADNKVQQTTVLFGVISGLTFSLSLWCYETILLSRAHVAYAWIPLVVGTLLCVLACTLAAGLTYLANRALLGIVFWLLAALLVAELTIALPLRITPWLMKLIEPGLRPLLPVYPYNEMVRAWELGCSIWLAIFFAMSGLLQLTLVEQAARAPAPASRLTPYFVCIPIMLLASTLTSNIVNEQLRAPLIALNDVIQFAVDNQGKPVDPILAGHQHLSTMRTFSDLITRPRRLFLGSFDGAYGQVEVLVDFSGTWVNCTTVNSQPVFCQTLGNP
jgi:hypothetical protein